MVVMRMRDEHRVERRQIIERDAGVIDPLRAGPRRRAGAFRPDGVDQDVDALRLDEHRRMADEGDAQRRSFRALRRHVADAGKLLRPGRTRTAAELPFEEIEAAALGRVAGKEKPCSVEVIGDRAAIIGIFRHGRASALYGSMPIYNPKY